MSDAKNILQRINAVQLEVDYIQKERKSGMNYSIVSHDAVTAKVRPLMVKHGIVYYPSNMKLGQNGNRTEMQCEVIFASIDNPADSIAVATAGYGIDTQDKGIGKAISYAVKYALLKALGLETGDDPDLDQGAEHEPEVIERKSHDRSPLVRKEYERIDKGLNDIFQTGSLEDLRAFWTAEKLVIEHLPADWRGMITAKKDEIKEQLGAKAA